MTVHVETGQRPGSSDRPIQDRIVVLDRAAAILGVASSWAPDEGDGGGAADLLADELQRCLQRPGDSPLAAHLADAIRRVMTRVSRDGGPPVPGGALPTAALICRWTDDSIEVLTLGDSTAIVYTRDGRAHRVYDDRLDGVTVEQRTANEAHRAGEHSDGEDHTRPLVDLQAVQRVIREAIMRSWPRVDVDAVLLMTEGVANVVDRYAVNGFPHWHNVLDLVAADGTQALIDHVHAVEDTDPNGRRWPRRKAHDDKAAVFIITETYDLRTRPKPPYSTLAAADRAMERGDYGTAIDMYASVNADFSSAAEQAPSDDGLADALYHSHLGQLDALAHAGRLEELASLAETDRHARRRLDRQLHDEGRADELRTRAASGDNTALYLLIRLLRTQGDDAAARQAVEDIAPGNEHARQLAYEPCDPGAQHI